MIFTSAILTDYVNTIFKVEIPICRKNIITEEMHIIFKIIWIIIHFSELIMIFYSVIKLISIKDEFNMSLELIIVGGIWLTTETIFLLDSFLFIAIDFKIVLILDILRNFAVVFVSGFIPLLKSFKSINLPICRTKECASNFNLLLITEKCYESFYEYMLINMPEGAKLLNLWTELNVFKYSTNKNELKILSTDIYQKYLNENSEHYVDFPPDIIQEINSSYKYSSKNTYNSVFDYLVDYAYDSLRDIYYKNFKTSEEYKRLEKELDDDEVIYSRLVASSMISSLEIE